MGYECRVEDIFGNGWLTETGTVRAEVDGDEPLTNEGRL
jgi:hypothetical protein